MKRLKSLVFASIFFLLFIAFLFSPKKTTSVNAQVEKRPLKYYLVDRVRSNADFAKLAQMGINTAIVDFKVGPKPDSPSTWDSVVNAAASAGINIVIWPDGYQGSDVSGCRWETPFSDADIQGGDFIVQIKPILDRLGNKPNVIGIVTAHEPVWVASKDQDRCSENIADMTTIKTQIHDYMKNTVKRDPRYPSFKVWNYIDNIYNMSTLGGYSSANRKAQIEGIMDVAVIWQHCAGYPKNAGDNNTPCDGTSQYAALGGINYDRNLIKNSGLEGVVEEVFIIQTFNDGSGSGDYGGKFTLDELKKYSAMYLDTNNLDGFGYYTWDEGWYSGNLKKWTDLQPAISYIGDYINQRSANKPTQALKPTPTNVITPTYIPTKIPTPTPTELPTKTPTPEDVYGDLNGDRLVNVADYEIMKTDFGKEGASGFVKSDLDGNGKVDIYDFNSLIKVLLNG